MFGNMGDMLKQVREMQANMAKIQEELKEKTIEVSTGGGMVKATFSGKQELVHLKIDPDVVDPDDIEMLEDLVIAAVNQGLKKSGEMMQEEMQKATGGLDLGGMLGNLGL